MKLSKKLVLIVGITIVAVAAWAFACPYCNTGDVIENPEKIQVSMEWDKYISNETMGKCSKNCGMHETYSREDICKICDTVVYFAQMQSGGTLVPSINIVTAHSKCSQCNKLIPCPSVHSCSCSASAGCFYMNCPTSDVLLCGKHPEHNYCLNCSKQITCPTQHSCYM